MKLQLSARSALFHLSLFSIPYSLIPYSLSAAVPLAWTVETSRATPATFEAYQGETLEFAAALQSYGKPLAAPEHYSFFWQTNGMGSTYWEVKLEKEVGVGERETPLSHSNSSLQLETPPDNILRATWSPEMDVGARVYNCFLGSPTNIYRAAFQLRMRPSPGALPNVLPLPQPVIDFAQVKVLNPPWPMSADLAPATNYTDTATNALDKALRGEIAAYVSETNTVFSNAVLAVGIDTNAVEQIGELKQFFDDLPPGTVGTSLGGIVLALLGAVAWLKKRINRLSEFKSDVPTIGDIAKTLGWTGEDQN